MATSDSDDFESADEEVEFRMSSSRKSPTKWTPQQFSDINSDTDDDNDCITSIKGNSWSSEISDEKCTNKPTVSHTSLPSVQEIQPATKLNSSSSHEESMNLQVEVNEIIKGDKKGFIDSDSSMNVQQVGINTKTQSMENTSKPYGNDTLLENTNTIDNKSGVRKKERSQRQQKQRESQKPTGLGAKKLGIKITSDIPSTTSSLISDELNTNVMIHNNENKPPVIQESWEFDDDKATKILQRESLKSHENAWHRKKCSKSSNISDELSNDNVPEELKSDKKFKEVFNTDGWEDFVDEDKIINDFHSEKKIVEELDTKPIDKPQNEMTNSGGSWSSWGSWGVTSLLNTATASVSTLTSHVTHGLTLLEETIGVPDPVQLVQPQITEANESVDEKSKKENNQMSSFGFSNLMSGVSSITKLVESTGTKVINGGLGTLETIGKKTMEVLQEGDPGLKKKRAFFLNEGEKPILSKILREAKEKAEVAEKTIEEKQQARKVHFETLFDDFQGLVHLEALEMLSKQSNMKIQQRMVILNADEINSIQETLDEVNELCDLGDEDDEEECDNGDLRERLKLACADLGVEISCEKIYELWEKTKTYVSDVSEVNSSISNKEIFQNAISSLAQFTAYCVERFHKTAELLLIKERRSTVNEADALVQLTQIFSGQIGIVANSFSKCLTERIKRKEDADDEVDITTIFLEATNASSYIQDAFRLLIPILQAGAI
ncbi:hypothetical protein PV327_004759 [Microctonus hyperodae]|uniref:Protein FAM114A2 n=1 Tax=Microctonus hyperodae TaxID=165561 RepID=A0AA39KN14_MICHY|nr:hypothetical protein PV327_004759 [Microctonus hyperodae]